MVGTDENDKNNKPLETVLEQKDNEAQNSGKAKRHAQHEHWMRVMMEGQATPDLRYQKPKI